MSNSEVVARHACDKCGSSDANTEFDDGHWYCFVCEKQTVRANGKKGTQQEMVDHSVTELNTPSNLKYGPLLDRAITLDTMKKYGVRLKVRSGVPIEHFYPYTDSKGNRVAWKIRDVATKNFPTMGDIKRASLFGMHLFPRGGKYVTITEGEIDAMAAFQMQGSKYTVVSVKNGAKSAYKNCKADFEWLDSFDNIIICFDADKEGKAAAAKVASLWPRKSKVVALDPKYKDAGGYLEASEWETFNSTWWRAERYVPDDIITGDKAWELVNKKKPEARWQYPWDGLNYMTYGIRTGELVIVTAGSGMGKTTVLREVSHHVMAQSKDNVGLIFLEEQGADTVKGMMSVQASVPFHLPDAEYTAGQYKDAFDAVWRTDRVFTLDASKMGPDIDYVTDRIRYMAIGLGIKFFVLDHISYLVSSNIDSDERKLLDLITHRLSALCTELDISIHAVVHTKRKAGRALEEGGEVSLSDLRGSGGLGQLAHIVFGLERDGQNDDKRVRNTTLARVVKNRFCGRTGPACKMLYDEQLGRLSELEEISDESDA